MAERISEDAEPLVAAHCDSASPGLQTKSLQIQRATRLGVARVQELESAVAPETINDLGIDPSTDPTGGLQHRDLMSLGGCQSGGVQARQARANDHYVHDFPVSSELSGVRTTQSPSLQAHAP